MTTAEQDIEMYMRVYAAAVTALMRRGDGLGDVRAAADAVANDAVKALRKRLETETATDGAWCGSSTDGGRYSCEFTVGHEGPHGFEREHRGKRWD